MLLCIRPALTQNTSKKKTAKLELLCLHCYEIWTHLVSVEVNLISPRSPPEQPVACWCCWQICWRVRNVWSSRSRAPYQWWPVEVFDIHSLRERGGGGWERRRRGRQGEEKRRKQSRWDDSVVNSMQTRVNSVPHLTAGTVAMNRCFVHLPPPRGPAHVSYSALGLKSH